MRSHRAFSSSEGVSWGAAGGLLKVVRGEEFMPTGTLRLLLTTKASTAGLTLPRSLLFVCEPEIVEHSSADVVIRRFSGDPVQHCFLFKRGVRGAAAPRSFLINSTFLTHSLY